MKIVLKNIKIHEDMSEETTCFSAQIYVNGKRVGYCSNNGTGGSTDINQYPGYDISLADNYLRTLPDIVYPACKIYGAFSVKSNLENWIDKQISDKLQEKENAKYEKQLNKDCLKYICHKVDGGYRMIGWKNYTVTQLLGTPVGNKMIQTAVDKLKAEGQTILNKNLVGIEI